MGLCIICRKKENLTDAKEYKGKDLVVSSIKELRDYFEISMDILKNKSSHFILPGYNNEEGIFIGQNVEIARNTKINAPVLLLNNIRLKELVSVGPNVIIGENVLIDTAADIKDSVVYDSSYVGMDLEIKEKFICRRKLADANSGEILEITENFLISGLARGEGERKPFFLLHWLGGLFLLVLMLPSYIILRILAMVTNDIKYSQGNYFLSDAQNSIELKIPKRYSGWNIFNHIFFKFSLYKVPLLFKVLKGNLYLVGNSPQINNNTSKRDIEELDSYFPAVFSYAEMLQTDQTEAFENHINELYYSKHASFWFNFKIVILSLFRNLFK